MIVGKLLRLSRLPPRTDIHEWLATNCESVCVCVCVCVCELVCVRERERESCRVIVIVLLHCLIRARNFQKVPLQIRCYEILKVFFLCLVSHRDSNYMFLRVP